MTQILVNTIGTLILIVLLVIDIVNNNNDDTKETKFVRTIFELAIAIILLLFSSI